MVILVEDIRALSKPVSTSLFHIYKIIDSISSISIAEKHERRMHKEAAIHDKYNSVNWKLSFLKCSEQKMNDLLYVSTDRMDRHFASIYHSKNLQRDLLSDPVVASLKDKQYFSNFLVDICLSKFNTKQNDDIRIKICEYYVKYKQRRRYAGEGELKLCPKEHNIIILPPSNFRRSQMEKVEFML